MPEPEVGTPTDPLMQLAQAAAQRAYVPYSKFRVGAAVEVDGKTYTGCNVENASYGLTVCAERVTMFTAIAAGNRRVERLAVTCVDASQDQGPDSRMPCGACRQVMSELMGPDAEVLVDGAGRFTVRELLPRAFTL